MARIANQKDFKDWLDGRPGDVRAGIAIALAARVALRVLPFAQFQIPPRGGKQRTRSFIQLTAAIFRCTALARAAAKYPARANELRAAYAADAAAAYAADAAYAAYAYAARAASASAAAASASASAARAASASASAAASAASAASAIWESIETDCNAVEQGATAPTLAKLPLWLGQEEPRWVRTGWRKIIAALPKDQDWDVWVAWYERRLKGDVDNERHDMAFATVPVELWDKGPQFANAWIKKQVGEIDAERPRAEQHVELPVEHKVVRFGLKHGRIDTIPSRVGGDVSASEAADEKAALAAARKFLEHIQNSQIANVAKAVANLIDLFESGLWREPDLLRQACRPIISKATVYSHPEAKWEMLTEHVDELFELSLALRDLQRFVNPAIAQHERDIASVDLTPAELRESSEQIDDLTDLLEALPHLVSDDVADAFETGKIAFDVAETTEDKRAIAVARIFVKENLVIGMARDLLADERGAVAQENEHESKPEPEAGSDGALKPPGRMRPRTSARKPPADASNNRFWSDFGEKTKKRIAAKGPDKIGDEIVKMGVKAIGRVPRTLSELAAVIYILTNFGPHAAGGAMATLWLGNKLLRLIRKAGDDE